MERAIQSITSNLSHLPLSSADFVAECGQGCCNPRVIQTMGMPLPFLLVLAEFAIQEQRPQDKLPLDSSNSRIYDVDCAQNINGARIDYNSHPPQVVELEAVPIANFCALSLHRYTGPLMDVKDYLGAPKHIGAYRRWLAGQPDEAFQTNSIRATVLRQMREQSDVFSKENQHWAEKYLHRCQMIGDYSVLSPEPQLLAQTRKYPLPNVIFLNYLTLDMGDD